jgi:hypothetical protein
MDELLKSHWAADVPASDPRFVLAVMTRIEQRRYMRELLMTAGLTVSAMVLLWLIAPAVATLWRDGIAPYASDVAILLSLMGITIVLPQFFPARN